jgi:lipopolysaccharide export system permease protein
VELIEMRKNYIKLNYSINDLNLHLLNLFSYPFYLVLMTLISSVIMLNSKNLTNKYLKIIFGLFASVTIYNLYNYFYVLGLTEKINIILSILLPLFILLIINSYFLRNINAK